MYSFVCDSYNSLYGDKLKDFRIDKNSFVINLFIYIFSVPEYEVLMVRVVNSFQNDKF